MIMPAAIQHNISRQLSYDAPKKSGNSGVAGSNASKPSSHTVEGNESQYFRSAPISDKAALAHILGNPHVIAQAFEQSSALREIFGIGGNHSIADQVAYALQEPEVLNEMITSRSGDLKAFLTFFPEVVSRFQDSEEFGEAAHEALTQIQTKGNDDLKAAVSRYMPVQADVESDSKVASQSKLDAAAELQKLDGAILDHAKKSENDETRLADKLSAGLQEEMSQVLQNDLANRG